MKIIVAGSRTANYGQVRRALECCPWSGLVSCVVSGGARGADEFGEAWARDNGIDIEVCPAEWEKHGKRAGPLRNRQMAELADGLIAVWDGKSRGTANMIEMAKELGLRVFVYLFELDRIVDVRASGKLADLWELADERAAMMEFSGTLMRAEAERRAGREISMRRCGVLQGKSMSA